MNQRHFKGKRDSRRHSTTGNLASRIEPSVVFNLKQSLQLYKTGFFGKVSMEFDTEHFDLLVMRTRFAHYTRDLRNLVSLEKGNVERHASA